ncbi:MAG: 30S ribosomal protein S9 [Candidatus Diapherotrites archaeon]|uniref:30S ribosomal protein S9 n=1 Tax=Candidatus Iainarchaeum sp. TaxID=3101447 RepID=A0A8T4C5L8_9ARCH|nr:30S ribosomal protein S9 [Candidatus Diapherotrites archaeon]
MAKRKKQTLFKAKKKEATAQATIHAGKGVVRINTRNLELVEPASLRALIQEPIVLAGEAAQGVNISVHVHGSGPISQAIAARGTIAKALVEYTGDEKLRKRYLEYDRMLLVDDPRRTEPKKPLGPKARRKKQHSKR